MKNIICVISGPTASGKTSTSILLAKKYNGVVVNFDSLVFYKEISIGTAKPTKEEQDGIPHYLVGTQSINEPLNAASFLKLAEPIIQKIHAEDKIVFLVGGSGFYLQALLNGMYKSQTTPDEITYRSNQLYNSEGIEPFINELKINDPISMNKYHENDHYRIRRAVEHFWTTGEKFSDARESMEEKKKNSPTIKNNWNIFHAYLDLPKDEHYEVIQKRTKEMIAQGLLDEVSTLLKNGFTGQEKPLQSIGYKESLDFLNGKFESKEDFIERINISTRQLAKSQRTWFKKVEKHEYHPLKDQKKLISDFDNYLNQL